MLTDDIDPETFPEPFKTRNYVWKHTLSICDRLPPPPAASMKYKLSDEDLQKRYSGTRIAVVDVDTFTAAHSLLSPGKKVAVLNLADDFMPLGYPHASGAQEESLARRSTLSQHLDIKMYPIDDTSGIYSENVVVFKDTEANGYRTIPPFKVDVVTVPGVRHPRLLKDGHMQPEEICRMENKIRLMYQMAAKHSVDRLVLGASSCGAWRGNPEDIAEAFKKIGKEYDGVCEQVVFAIMKPTSEMLFTHRTPQAQCNFDVFKRVLTHAES